MPVHYRSYTMTVIGFLFAGALLFFLFNQISIGSIRYVSETLRPSSLMMIVLLYALVYWFRSLRFLALMDEKGIRLRYMFAVVSIHTLLNHVVPARTGELSYPYLLKRYQGVEYAQSGSGLVVVRLFDLIFLSALFLPTVYYQAESHAPSIRSLLLPVAGSTAVLILFMLNLQRIAQGLLRISNLLSEKLGLGSNPAVRSATAFMGEVATALGRMRTKTTYLRLCALTAVIWLSTFGVFYLFMRDIAPGLSFLDVVYASVFSLVASLLPINPMGSIGTMEAGWALGFVLVGVSSEVAIASGFAVHFIVMALALLWAFPGWVLLKRGSPS